MSNEAPAVVVVLAAGEGTRMRSTTPKVLHDLLGRSLLHHVLTAVTGLRPHRVAVVVGHAAEPVRAEVARSPRPPEPTVVVQERQDGTGHALRVALDTLSDVTTGTVVVVCGDAPLLTTDTLLSLLAVHEERGASATVLTARLSDPRGYGRIVRDGAGAVVGIVEDADATPELRSVNEVNSGMYAFDAAVLREALGRLRPHNSQGEEYLTDVVGLVHADGRVVAAFPADDPAEVLGVNDQVQLATARRLLRDRLLRRWMRDGVVVHDPATTWVDVDVALSAGAVLHPGTRLQGTTSVGAGAQVGPDCTLTDTVVHDGARVRSTTADQAVIGPSATVGPYTHLRPGVVLGSRAKAGSYVEIKSAVVADDAKVPHLSYVGDAEIGEGSNIGAGTIVANYDGIAKHRTVVGAHVRIGSDTVLIAPVVVGDGAYTAAGSVVTDDVEPGAIAVARSRQRTIKGWVARRRAGSPAARAAAAAQDRQTPVHHAGQRTDEPDRTEEGGQP